MSLALGIRIEAEGMFNCPVCDADASVHRGVEDMVSLDRCL